MLEDRKNNERTEETKISREALETAKTKGSTPKKHTRTKRVARLTNKMTEKAKNDEKLN